MSDAIVADTTDRRPPDLPAELYTHIFSCLPPKDPLTFPTLLSVLATNTYFRAAASAPSLWKRIYAACYTHCVPANEARRRAQHGADMKESPAPRHSELERMNKRKSPSMAPIPLPRECSNARTAGRRRRLRSARPRRRTCAGGWRLWAAGEEGSRQCMMYIADLQYISVMRARSTGLMRSVRQCYGDIQQPVLWEYTAGRAICRYKRVQTTTGRAARAPNGQRERVAPADTLSPSATITSSSGCFSSRRCCWSPGSVLVWM